MPLGPVNTTKELALTYQPLLLAVFTFTDGTVLRLSTHGLRAADGGFQYAGNDYLPRILNQDIAAIQALSDGGVDIPPSVTLQLNDGDQFLWANYEQTKGFRGARLTLTFAFWSVGQNDFSSDSVTKFTGVCSAPLVDETTLTVTSTSIMNFQPVQLPTIRIQKRCPWIFPRTAAERQQAADNEDSWFYECGYSPDALGANARGNLISGVPATTCNYTKEQCVARGMYSKDSALRLTGRFGGVQWDPPQSWRGRAYVEGKFAEGLNTSSEAKYSDVVPLVYGSGWIEPVITNVVGDANTTRFEAVICYGEVDSIDRVVVNDVELPAATNMDHTSRVVSDPNSAWYLVNRGDRDGAANALPGYDGAGDPYGSLATIACVVPRRLADSQNVPRVRVLVKGPKIRRYTDPVTFSNVGWPDNLNPAWALMDQLIWSGLDYADLDIQSFIDAAAVCDATVNFTDQDGANNSHARFMASMVIRQRRSAAEIIRGLRNSFRAILVPNSDAGGKLKLVIRQTLADQQPSPVPGSNHNTAVASKTAAGGAANGYVAYKFDESNIVRRGETSTLKISQRANSDTPNHFSLTFQDIHNNFAPDSLTVIETDALVRGGNQDVAGNFPLDGVNNFDQGKRIIALLLAEAGRGNPRNNPLGDAGGTLQFELASTFKCVHLQVAQLCLLSYSSLGIADQLIRIQRIQPSTNFETCRVTATWHSDEWYLDSYGQEGAPRYSGERRNRLARPPFPLLGQSGTGGLTNPDPLYGRERFFSLSSTLDDEDVLRFRAAVRVPVNTFPAGFRPPYVPNEGTSASTGGSLAGNQDHWIALCAINAEGEITAPSVATRIRVPAGTSTNTITVPDIDWDSATTQYALFVGTDPNRLHYQSTTTGTPASVTFVGPVSMAQGRPIPDGEFDFLRLKVKRARNLGVFAAEVDSVTATTIKVANAYWNTNQWAGYDCSVIGSDYGGYDIPSMWSFRVTSNTSDTLTVDTAYSPPPTVMSFANGERYLMVMRAKPSTVSANTIGDANFDNSLMLEDPLQVEDATNATPISIKVTGHSYSTGQKVRIDYVTGNTAANGVWTITVVDADNFSLGSSVGNGAYTGAGTARRLTGGLATDEAAGKLVRIIAGLGRGQVRKIASNTPTVLTIEGAWTTTPDATSRFITEEPDWFLVSDSSPLYTDNFNPSVIPEFGVDLTGYARVPLLITPVGVDGGGNEALEGQVADFYLFRDVGLPAATGGGALQLVVDGTLAIGSDLAPRAELSADARALAVKAIVKTAPIGSGLTLKLKLDTADWMTLTIAAGQVEVSATADQIAGAADISAGQDVRLDLTAVGTTFPGADLTVLIYF